VRGKTQPQPKPKGKSSKRKRHKEGDEGPSTASSSAVTNSSSVPKRQCIRVSLVERMSDTIGGTMRTKDAKFIGELLPKHPEMLADLIHTIVNSRAFIDNKRAVTRAFLLASPTLVDALLDPAVYDALDRSSYNHAVFRGGAVSMLLHAHDDTAVFAKAAIAACAAHRATNTHIINVATRALFLAAERHGQETVDAACVASLNGSTMAPLTAILAGTRDSDRTLASSACSVVESLIRLMPIGAAGLRETVAILLNDPLMFAPHDNSLVVRIAFFAASDTEAERNKALVLLEHILRVEPVRALASTGLLCRLARMSGSTGLLVLEHVARLTLARPELKLGAEMEDAIKAATAVLNPNALCVLARANRPLFLDCAERLSVAHEFVRLGGDLRALFDGLDGLDGLDGPSITQLLARQKSREPYAQTRNLVETAVATGNFGSAHFLLGTGLAFPDADAAASLLRAMAAGSVFATTQASTREGTRWLLDLAHAAHAARSPRDAAFQRTVMREMGLAGLLLRIGTEEAIDAIQYAAKGSSQADLIMEGLLVQRSLDKKRLDLTKRLIELLAADSSVYRLMADSQNRQGTSSGTATWFKVLSDAPLTLVRALYSHMQRECAPLMATMQECNEHLRQALTLAGSVNTDNEVLERDTERREAELRRLRLGVSFRDFTEDLALRVVQHGDRKSHDELLERLVFFLGLGSNMRASTERVFRDPKSAHFVTAFMDPSVWPHVVAAHRSTALDELVDGWTKYAFDFIYDTHEGHAGEPLPVVISRQSLASKDGALSAMSTFAEFYSKAFPRTDFLNGILGSTILGSDGEVIFEERDTATGPGQQSDFLNTFFRALTSLEALFVKYPSGLVPRPDADPKLLRLLGWVLGSMLCTGNTTGFPCVSPAILAMLMGIDVPSQSFVGALTNGTVPATFDGDAELALSCFGEATQYFTSEQTEELTAKFGAAAFPEFAREAECHVHATLRKRTELVAEGFREAIVGGPDHVSPPLEANAIEALASIFFDGQLGSYKQSLARIEARTAGRGWITAAEIRQRAVYDGGLTGESPVVRMFWAVVSRMTPDEVAELFYFWTGQHAPRTDAPPSATTCKITGRAGPAALLRSQTCSSTLYLRTGFRSEQEIREFIKASMAENNAYGSMHDGH
jgi:hypothetical protein